MPAQASKALKKLLECTLCEYGENNEVLSYCLEHNPEIMESIDGFLVPADRKDFFKEPLKGAKRKKYFQWKAVNLQSALRERSRWRFKLGDTMPPSYRLLEQKYGVPASTIKDKVPPPPPSPPTVRAYPDLTRPQFNIMTKNKWQWNHPELVLGKAGMDKIVPDYLREYFAGYIAWCDGPEVKQQMTMDQAGPALLMLMDAHKLEYPNTWVDNDGPPKDWWTKFLDHYKSITLVRALPPLHSRDCRLLPV